MWFEGYIGWSPPNLGSAAKFFVWLNKQALPFKLFTKALFMLLKKKKKKVRFHRVLFQRRIESEKKKRKKTDKKKIISKPHLELISRISLRLKS